jgi:hypothetical protein
MVPIIIGFLASVIGLGGIGQKIREIVEKLQKPVNKALDFLIKTGLKLAGPSSAASGNLGGKAKAKFQAGKAWVTSKATAAKDWATDKAKAGKEWAKGKSAKRVARAGSRPRAVATASPSRAEPERDQITVASSTPGAGQAMDRAMASVDIDAMPGARARVPRPTAACGQPGAAPDRGHGPRGASCARGTGCRPDLVPRRARRWPPSSPVLEHHRLQRRDGEPATAAGEAGQRGDVHRHNRKGSGTTPRCPAGCERSPGWRASTWSRGAGSSASSASARARRPAGTEGVRGPTRA